MNWIAYVLPYDIHEAEMMLERRAVLDRVDIYVSCIPDYQRRVQQPNRINPFKVCILADGADDLLTCASLLFDSQLKRE